MTRAVLGRRASFLTAGAVVAHTIWTSAAPVLSYPLYASEWHLTTFATTAIFAVYPVFVVAILVVFGNLSDFIGRREAMLIGLGFSAAGSIMFAVAPDVRLIFLGRALMGIGVGLSAGPSAAAVVEFSSAHRVGQAGSVTAAAQSIGMMAAALIGGVLIQFAPLPLRLNFVVLAVVLIALFGLTWFMPNHTVTHAQGRWSPRLPAIPRGDFAPFVTATAAVTCSYVLGAMTLSLGAQVARDVVASSNALVNGGTIALFALSSALLTIPARGMRPSRVITIGGILAVAASALLAISGYEHSLALYTFAQAGAGGAYSLLLLGGLGLMNAHTPATHRGATLSALFLVAYLGQAVAALSLGQVATRWSLGMAVDIGVGLIATLAVITLLLDAVRRKSAAPRSRTPSRR